jgi:hypothetical protein
MQLQDPVKRSRRMGSSRRGGGALASALSSCTGQARPGGCRSACAEQLGQVRTTQLGHRLDLGCACSAARSRAVSSRPRARLAGPQRSSSSPPAAPRTGGRRGSGTLPARCPPCPTAGPGRARGTARPHPAASAGRTGAPRRARPGAEALAEVVRADRPRQPAQRPLVAHHHPAHQPFRSPSSHHATTGSDPPATRVVHD